MKKYFGQKISFVKKNPRFLWEKFKIGGGGGEFLQSLQVQYFASKRYLKAQTPILTQNISPGFGPLPKFTSRKTKNDNERRHHQNKTKLPKKKWVVTSL